MDTNVNTQRNQMFWTYCTEAKMWHVAFSSLAAKQQPANRYVVSKPSNYKWYMHTHICRREQEINTKP